VILSTLFQFLEDYSRHFSSQSTSAYSALGAVLALMCYINDVLWKSIFLHRELTPREREARRLLVQELKDRKTAGEANLIIVNGRIVSRRPDVY